jgi:hypothetical protein
MDYSRLFRLSGLALVLAAGEAIRSRRKAWVGWFRLGFFRTILTEGDFYANTLVTPIVAREAPAFLDSPLAGFLQVWLPFSFTVLAFSWLLLAVATMRTRVYSRTAS